MRKFEVKYYKDIVTLAVHTEIVNANNFNIKDGMVVFHGANCNYNIHVYNNIIRVREITGDK